MKKQTIIKLTITAIVVIAAGLFINFQLNEINNKIESLESANELDEIVADMVESRYDECVTDAYETYSDNWDRACWGNNSDSDCRLTIADRYQVEQDYQNEVLGCLAEYK